MLIAPAGAWAGEIEPHRGAVVSDIAESIDLLPTIADLAGLPLPAGQLSPGQSLAPVLRPTTARAAASVDASAPLLEKRFAMAQWARRRSCLHAYSCLDGHGDPSSPVNDTALMGYTLRTDQWRYTAWFNFDFGAPGGNFNGASAPGPVWDQVTARELYDHRGDVMGVTDAEGREWDNLASDTAHADTVAALHKQLVGIVKAGLAKPIQ